MKDLIRVRAWQAYLVVAGLIATAGLLLGAYAFNRAATESERLRQTQIESCKQVGDPIQRAVRDHNLKISRAIKAQIEQAARVTPELFPHIPPEVFRELQRETREERRESLRALREIRGDLIDLPTCEERFGEP